ncbi:MAG: pyruvate:ferredoxin (flavodoxin) oxidoreductase [Chromatiales bacterium]
MSGHDRATIDANEAVARIAYALSEVCAIYPITPSSPMAELADQWVMAGRKNLWNEPVTVAEMQSEGGVAGAVHGALQAGALTSTFTASQGLLLMIPNMCKIAGELTPTVFHVAARALAYQGLSIFGDHSDVMATRSTGFAQLCSASVQEAQDLAAVAHAATLQSRVPFLHFFDGFRTSHEVNRLELLNDEDLLALIPDAGILAHRERALDPERPFIRGTAQNPDVYFQGREAGNPFYAATPAIVERLLGELGERTGRRYGLFDYSGHPQAERVIVIMGSGGETAAETAARLAGDGDPVGVVQVRLYRPFSAEHLLAALPDTVHRIAVLDRTKEAGSVGEPLYLDVVAAFSEALAAGRRERMPRIIGGRYGLGSKEFTPAMVAAVFAELGREQPRAHFTVGIEDDVGGTSLPVDASYTLESDNWIRAVFYGLGADGTVGANKNSIKIIGEDPERYAQAYFVYDSKKSGAQTVSHLRFGSTPVRAPYLVQSANFIGCHQFNFIYKTALLDNAAPGAVFLLNSPYDPQETWRRLPRPMQERIIAGGMTFYVVDAYRVAQEQGMGNRINTIMQTCFFAVSKVMPQDQAIARIKAAIEKTYGRKGPEIVRKNFAAVDNALAGLHRVEIPPEAHGELEFWPPVPARAPAFVREVTGAMLAGKGDRLPVSALPPDGTFPSGTTQWEKRNIATHVPYWEPELCIQCGNCSYVCPHAVIRAKFYDRHTLDDAPEGFRSAPLDARGFPDIRYSLQVFAEDCTGCGLCVEACPVRSKEQVGRRAINMREKAPQLDQARRDISFFESIADNDRSRVDFSSVRGVQFMRPLFEFSGACAGCGETPYLRLASQLFGNRMLVANATGCSSIYGGNLPTTPWTTNADGQGPAWSNSLFEDNAEFGLGFRLSADNHLASATALLHKLAPQLDGELVRDILDAPQRQEAQLYAQHLRVGRLKEQLQALDSAEARRLLSLADHFVRRSVWIVGGDGWAYDIGSSGLDHVLASGRDVNILVLDTEVYSNTGGQMSKATPPGAVAKFAAGGKEQIKKDLALQAIAYGNVYVARVAMGANPQQTLLAFREAEAYPGPSLILAYSHCIAHGINMQKGMEQQHLAVDSGYWPLMRYDPALGEEGGNPFMLDSRRPRIALKDYAYNELRYRMLANSNPERAAYLLGKAEQALWQRWSTYEEMSTRDPHDFRSGLTPGSGAEGASAGH